MDITGLGFSSQPLLQPLVLTFTKHSLQLLGQPKQLPLSCHLHLLRHSSMGKPDRLCTVVGLPSASGRTLLPRMLQECTE